MRARREEGKRTVTIGGNDGAMGVGHTPLTRRVGWERRARPWKGDAPSGMKAIGIGIEVDIYRIGSGFSVFSVFFAGDDGGGGGKFGQPRRKG